MKLLQQARQRHHLSQRRLAEMAAVSYKTIQLVESGKHDTQVSTLKRITTALGYPPYIVEQRLNQLFQLPTDSIAMISEWKVGLFNCVDAFRRTKDIALIAAPPSDDVSIKIKALLASTVEALCAELDAKTPWWCSAIPALDEPWFVAEVENLIPLALVESPVYFRQRNIFVLANFLERR